MENYITKYCPPTTEDAEYEIDYKLSDVILVGEKTPLLFYFFIVTTVSTFFDQSKS